MAKAEGRIQRNGWRSVGAWDEAGRGRASATRRDLGWGCPRHRSGIWGTGQVRGGAWLTPPGACSPSLRSFVVGSDGYVYEGRGWHWVGAHTRGHNSRGFGVAFVGNYTAELPTETALRTVRDVLPRCAVRAGLLRPSYRLLGHRQLVPTTCPGDALFDLLRTWPRFDAVSAGRPRTAGRRALTLPVAPVPPQPQQGL